MERKDEIKYRFTKYLETAVKRCRKDYLNKKYRKDKMESPVDIDMEEKERIFLAYRPLLLKYAMVENRFDEDLYQELSKTLLNCITRFCIN